MSIYLNNSKHHWRYWVWKRIKDRCPTLASQATVLFLSGPSPEDLAAANKFGFRKNNLVAVDINKSDVDTARKAGCIAIQGTLFDVVSGWDDGEIHGLIADYCCGLTTKIATETMLMSAYINGGIVANFQRGRECDDRSRIMRDILVPKFTNSIHRGEQFAHFMAVCAAMPLTGMSVDDFCELSEPGDWGFLFDIFCKVGEQVNDFQIAPYLEKILRYETTSYRSNVVLMDSIAFKSCVKFDTTAKESCRKKFHSLMEIGDSISANPRARLEIRSLSKLKDRLVACKAVRTIRGASKFN